MTDATPVDPAIHDFDFLFGRWRVSHRRLAERLNGCTRWETFAGTSTVQPLMNGLGNVDDNVLELPGGHYRAVSLRAFDPGAREWAIWWLDGRHPRQIDAPVRGRFEGGVGTFLCDDTFDGKPIVVRYLWSGITPVSARWEQAFSADGGRQWETNWIMAFDRL